MTTTRSLSVHRSTPRTRSGAVPEPQPSPTRTVPKSSGNPRTPFSFGAITPAVGIQKVVWLSDWWLTNKKGLGIEGFESEGGSVVRRVFSSGTIAERLDSVTLATSDGITVSITGFINTSRTLHNGFSLEVCNRFLSGFPYNWKDYNETEKEEDVPKDFAISFDDIPVSRLQDLLLTPSSSLKNGILDDVLDGLRDFVSQKSAKNSVPKAVGVNTRSMLKRRQDEEASIGQRVSNKRNQKGVKLLQN